MTAATEHHDADPGLRWGLLGASRIAGRRFIPAVRSTRGSVAAVAASTPARAEAFAAEHSIARACPSYRELLDSPDVDAVYLSLASALHIEWLPEIAAAGKPCLCEKPMVLRAEEAEEVCRAFAEGKLRLMEAFMWRHHPQVGDVLERIARGEIGELRRINATFSFKLDREEDFRWSAALGGGALFDLGSYAVNAARLFFADEPQAGSVREHIGPGVDAVDHSAAGWLDFGFDRFATFNVSYTSSFAQGLELVGSKARIWLGRPWNNVMRETSVVVDDGMNRAKHPIAPADPFAFMTRHFTHAVLDPVFDFHPAEDGLLQARAMAALAASASARGGVISFNS